MNTAEQDSRLMYDNPGKPYPEGSQPWEWLASSLAVADAGLLSRWIEFVKDAHTNRTKSGKPQVRGNGTPYYYHPISVAILAAEHFDPMGRTIGSWDYRQLDWEPLCYAFFGHDLFEDTTVTRRDVIVVLGKGLGTRVCDIIFTVTKPDKTDEDRRGLGHLRYTHGVYSKYAKASDETNILKALDRRHNLSEMRAQGLPWRLRYLDDTRLLLCYLYAKYGLRELLLADYFRESRAYFEDSLNGMGK